MNDLQFNNIYEEIQNGNSFQQISSLLDFEQYLPFSDSSLNFSSLAIVLNDIVVNDRKFIVEFGTGTSTIIIAQLIKKNKLENVKFISVEHNKEWYEFMLDFTKKLNVDKYVEIIYAELSPSSYSLNDCDWYNEGILYNALKGEESIDCILVDGPPAWKKELSLSRYPAYNFLKPLLNSNFSIFLDDTNREGEKKIISEWEKDNLTKEMFSKSFTGLFKGNYFNIRLPKAKM